METKCKLTISKNQWEILYNLIIYMYIFSQAFSFVIMMQVYTIDHILPCDSIQCVLKKLKNICIKRQNQDK